MKKTLLLLTSVALLLVGCAKELIFDLQEGELTNVTFTTSLDNGVATKAAADNDGNGTKVNRCIMEIYYGDTFYKRLVEPVSGKVATFANVPVVAGKQYTVLFWADCGTENKTDKYYTTNGPDSLKAVTVKRDAFVNALQSKNNDELDAFFFAGNYTVSQNQAGSYTVTLKRPFAQLNVITTDVAAGKTVINADLLPEKVSVSYTAYNTFNVADSTASGIETYSYEAPVYGEKTNWETVKARGEFTLSMDYILASKDQKLVSVTFKTLNGTTEVMNHNLANLPYQRNYRTNVKGDLLTVGGTWKAEIEPKWGNGTDTGEINHETATSYTEVKTALQSGDKSDNLKVTVTPAAVNNLSDEEKAQVIVNETIGEDQVQALKFVLYEEKTTGEDIHHASPKHVEFELPKRPTGVGAWKIEYETNYPTQTVVVSTPPEDTDPTIIIEAPKSTVTLDATKINSVVSTTSENTLIIPQGLELKNLIVKKGAVEYHGTGLTKVKVEATGTDKVYFKTSEGLADTDDVYGVVKDHIAEGFAITKESETTWKIVPAVCKIDKTGYASLSDAVAAAPESSETTIKMVNDVDYGDIAGDGAVVIPSGKVIILDLNGKKISASRTVKTNTSIIANDGKLTIIDNAGTGEIYMNSTVDDSGWSSSVSAITNRATLIVNSGHIHTDGAAGMSYAIDSRQNGYSFDVVATINGGLIEAPNYRAIRLFANGTNGADNLVVTGGEIVGKTAGIWQQDANAHKNKSSVTISGGKITATDESRHALYIDGNTDTEGLSATITGGQFKSPAASVFVENCPNVSKFISGGIFSNQPDEALIAEGYISVENDDEAYPWKVKLDAPEGAVAKINSTFYNSLQEAFNAVQNEQTIELLTDITVEPKGTSNNSSNTSMTFNRSGISAVLDLCGHTINGDVTINKLLYVQKGNLSIRNGTIKHCYEEHGVYHTAIYIDNDASCPVITDLNINVSGTGIRLLSKASIGTLNAHIDSWVACKPSSGTTDFVCIYLSSADSKITEISGGYYASYMKNYVNSIIGTGAIYINNGTIQEISGGTFLGMYANGGTIRIDNGKIQKFSDGYVGFYEKTIDGQLCAFDKIDQITGGKFMSPQSSLENFERTKGQSSRVSALRAKVTSSGLLLVSKGEKVTVQNIKDGSSITMDVYEAVGNRLSIDGNGNPVSVQVKSGEKVIFPEEKTSVSGKKGFWFTASEGGEQVAYSPCALLNTSDRTLYFRLEDACLVTIKCPTYNNYVDVKSVSSGIVVRNNTSSSSQYMYVLKGEKISVVDYTLNEYTNSFGTYEMLGWKIENQVNSIEKNVEYVINSDVTVTYNSNKKQ